ncbi:MAG TPA: hypothetical protein VFY79_03045 [Dehalococcoidia bacterium]|jgi:hypothetical protein|nr:hypothetical protein [Dehalococcoidia bacterium]
MPDAGSATNLCPLCAHVRRVTSARGSTFLLCDRSRGDPRFPRYPRLPVTRCAGYEHDDASTSAAEAREQE